MWIIWAVICASLNAASSALTKRAATAGGVLPVTFWTFADSIPLTLAALWITGVPEIRAGFWLALAGGVLLNIVAISLRNFGLERAPLSLAVPLLAFTPAFLLITETLLLGDHPGTRGLAGVVLIVAGAYALNLERAGTGLLEPLRVVLRHRGCQLMLVVAALWSVTSVIDKICVVRSSPVFYLAVFHIGFVAGYLPLMAWRRAALARRRRQEHEPAAGHHRGRSWLRPPHCRLYALIALIHFGSILSQMPAVRLTLVSYVIAINRSGMLLSLLIGLIALVEPGAWPQLACAALISAGLPPSLPLSLAQRACREC